MLPANFSCWMRQSRYTKEHSRRKIYLALPVWECLMPDISVSCQSLFPKNTACRIIEFLLMTVINRRPGFYFLQ